MAGFLGRESDDGVFDGVWDSGDWSGTCLFFSSGDFLCAFCAAVFFLYCADEPEVLGEGNPGEGGLQSVSVFYDRHWYLIPACPFYGKLCKSKRVEFCD